MAAKGSRRVVVLGFLFLPLFYAAILRCYRPPHLWKLQLAPRLASNLSHRGNDKSVEVKEFTRFLLRRLVRGNARRELRRNGVACISDPESDIFITSDAVKLIAGNASTVLHLAPGQRLPRRWRNPNASVQVRPYARKTDALAMARTSPVTILPTPSRDALPACSVNHSVPAVIFSTGGFAGNFFHDVNDVIIPLFLTSAHLRSRVQFVITDHQPYWAEKYGRVISRLSSLDVVVASSPSAPADAKVHCFPAAVVGLKYHGNLLCDPAAEPRGTSTAGFRRFLHGAFSLATRPAGPASNPVMVLLSRWKSRKLLNEESVAKLAEGLGFRTVVAARGATRDLANFSRLVNGCSVLAGVHGAGMTNLMFLRRRAVLLQIVPWGLDWGANVYYGRPARQLGLRYVEYRIAVEESSLYGEYPKDHPVLTDPWGINLRGYNVSKPVYTDGQNVRLDLARFKETLLKVRELIGKPLESST